MSYMPFSDFKGCVEVVSDKHDKGQLQSVLLQVWDGIDAYPFARLTHEGTLELLPLTADAPLKVESGYIRVKKVKVEKVKGER